MRAEPIRFAASCALMLVAGIATAAPTKTTCNLPSTRAFCGHLNSLLKHTANKASKNVLTSDMDRLLVPTADMEAFVEATSPSLQDILSNSLTSQNSIFNKAVDAWEKARLDVQSGSTPSSSGSTSLVAKSGLTTLLSAAYEVGAFTKTTTGNTTTFHLNAGGLVAAIGHDEVVSPRLVRDPNGKIHDRFSWNNLDGSVSVDMDQSGSKMASVAGPANGSTTAPQTIMLPSNGGRVGAVALRYSVLAPFDPRSAPFQNTWNAEYEQSRRKIQAVAQAYSNEANKVAPTLAPALAQQQAKYGPKFQADADSGDGAQLEADFDEYFQTVLAIVEAQDSNFRDRLIATRMAAAAFTNANENLLNDVRKKVGASLTVEGDFNHPVHQPETYTGRLIYSHPRGQALFTVNGAVTMYGSIQAGAKYSRLRDGQLSAEFDTPLGDPKKSAFALTGAFYMQYQTDPSVLNITAGNLVPGTSIILPSNAQVLLGPSGLIVIGQGKLTFNTKSGIRIPLAVEYSNKTDLLNATDVRGNVGISYDFSSFSSLFGAKSN